MKNILTLSFIFSLLLMLAPAQSDAQFGDLIKKGKKSAQKVIKQKSSKNKKDKKPKRSKQNKRNDDKDIAVVSTNEDSKEEASTYKYKKRPPGTVYVKDLVGDDKLRFEAATFLGDLFSGITSIDVYNLSIKSALPISDIHKPFFNKEDYDPQAAEPKYFSAIDKVWTERENEITEMSYFHIDKIFQESSRENSSERYNRYGDLHLELYAKTLSNLSTYLYPENQNLKDLTKYAETRLATLKSTLDEQLDEVSINDVHRANLNKILFTNNKNINPQTAPASAYKTNFVPGEEIYAVAMLDKGIHEKLVRDNDPEYQFLMNGNFTYDKFWIEHESINIKNNQQYLVFPVVAKASNFKCSKTISTPQIERGMEHLATYGPRKHKVTLQVNDNGALHNKSGALKGDFTIDGAKGDMTIYQKMANAIRDKCPRD